MINVNKSAHVLKGKWKKSEGEMSDSKSLV